MNTKERLQKINDLSEELQSDMESTKDNHNDIRSNLVSAMNGLDDLGLSYSFDLNCAIGLIGQSKENELNELIDKYIEKISNI